MECLYERDEFPDSEFELSILGLVHRGRPPLHLANGEVLRIVDLDPPMRIRFESMLDDTVTDDP